MPHFVLKPLFGWGSTAAVAVFRRVAFPSRQCHSCPSRLRQQSEATPHVVSRQLNETARLAFVASARVNYQTLNPTPVCCNQLHTRLRRLFRLCRKKRQARCGCHAAQSDPRPTSTGQTLFNSSSELTLVRLVARVQIFAVHCAVVTNIEAAGTMPVVLQLSCLRVPGQHEALLHG